MCLHIPIILSYVRWTIYCTLTFTCLKRSDKRTIPMSSCFSFMGTCTEHAQRIARQSDKNSPRYLNFKTGVVGPSETSQNDSPQMGPVPPDQFNFCRLFYFWKSTAVRCYTEQFHELLGRQLGNGLGALFIFLEIRRLWILSLIYSEVLYFPHTEPIVCFLRRSNNATLVCNAFYIYDCFNRSNGSTVILETRIHSSSFE